MKAIGSPYRILAGHGVGHEQDLLGGSHSFDLDQFIHQHIIDVQTTRCVQDDDVVCSLTCLFDRVGTDLRRRHAGVLGVHRDVNLTSQYLQLLYGGWPAGVGSD